MWLRLSVLPLEHRDQRTTFWREARRILLRGEPDDEILFLSSTLVPPDTEKQGHLQEVWMIQPSIEFRLRRWKMSFPGFVPGLLPDKHFVDDVPDLEDSCRGALVGRRCRNRIGDNE